tara:strand:- start:53 stop:922 length:870 start_codon:yes stop_codon:yes gene_type:complete
MMQQMLLGIGPGGIQVSDEYFYMPLNESSGSRTSFGNYASSVTINNGGQYDYSHPYNINDNTYNNGVIYSHRCNGQTDTCYLNANTKLGGVGTGDLCWDMYYRWIGEGNGGGSYGYVGDYSRGSSQLYPSHTGIDYNENVYCGAIGSNVRAGFADGGTYTNANSSLTTNSSNFNTWVHVLILRQSNKWYTFVNGVLDGYYAESSPADIQNGGGFHFGTIDRSGHWWNVRITDFMWQKGNDSFYSIDSSVGSGNIGTTYFTIPQYKNKLMAIPSNSSFSIVKAPTGFTTE